MLAVAGTLIAAGAISAPAHASYHQIANYGSGMCAGIRSFEYYYNGATVVQQPCNGSAGQLWSDVPLGGGYTGSSTVAVASAWTFVTARTPTGPGPAVELHQLQRHVLADAAPSYVPTQIKSGEVGGASTSGAVRCRRAR